MYSTFKSAVDWWFYATMILSLVVLVVAVVPVLHTGVIAGIGIMAIAALISLGLPVWLLFSTYYTITDSDLLIKSGPFSWRIPRHEIKEIVPTRSPLSSPALSLNRLKIRYGPNKAIIVSPQDRDGFIRALSLSTPT